MMSANAEIKELYLGPTSSEEHLWLSLHSSENCILLAPYPPTNIHPPAFSLSFPLSSISSPLNPHSHCSYSNLSSSLQSKKKLIKWRNKEAGQKLNELQF